MTSNDDPRPHAHIREIVRILRTLQPPPLPDYEHEREIQAQSRGPVRGGYETVHVPEERRYECWGTIDRVRVCGPYVARYWPAGPSLNDACESAIYAARRLTGEKFNDIVIYGHRKWTGPMG